MPSRSRWPEDDQPGEGFLGKVRRLNMTKLMAQEREILPITEDDARTSRMTPPPIVEDAAPAAVDEPVESTPSAVPA